MLFNNKLLSIIEIIKIEVNLIEINIINGNIKKDIKIINKLEEYKSEILKIKEKLNNNSNNIGYIDKIIVYITSIINYDFSVKISNNNIKKVSVYTKEDLIEKKRNFLLDNLPISNKYNILFSKYDLLDSENYEKQNELINFYYDFYYDISINKKEENIIFCKFNKNYNLLSNDKKEEFDKLIKKYKNYYSFNDKIPTLLDLTKKDNDIRYGIYKSKIFSPGNHLGYLSKDDIDKPLEMIIKRREDLIKCDNEKKEEFFKKVLEKEREVTKDKELDEKKIKNLSKDEKIKLLDKSLNNIRWGYKDFDNSNSSNSPNSCNNIEGMIDTIYKLNDIETENVKFNKKPYIYGFTPNISEYTNCSKYFRSRNMKISEGKTAPCSPYVEWQPILNKFYTFASSKTDLNFPIIFKLDKGKIPHKKRPKVDINEILSNKLIGLLSFKFIDNRTKKYKHPTERLDIFIYESKELSQEWLHREWTNFKIYDIFRENCWNGLIFSNKNVTYDEFNMINIYLKMNCWKLNDNTLLYTYKDDDYIKKLCKEKSIVLTKKKYTVKYINNKKEITNKYVIPDMRQKGGYSNYILSLRRTKTFKLFDKNIVSDKLFLERYNSYNYYWKELFGGNIKEALLYSYNLYSYNYIISNNITFLTTYDVKVNKKYNKLFSIKNLVYENKKNYSIIKYKPTSILFFNSWEILYKFKFIEENKKYDILEFSSNPSFLESCFYYEKKYKNVISNYNLIYPTKYLYSNKNIDHNLFIKNYIQFFKKNTKVYLHDKYFDKDFIFKRKDNKYDIIYTNISKFFNSRIGSLTYEHKNISVFFNIFCYCILNLKINGTFVMIVNNITTKPISDLLVFSKKYFEDIIPYQVKIYNKIKYFGTSVIFYNLKKNITEEDINSLEKIFTKINIEDNKSNKFIVKNEKNIKEYLAFPNGNKNIEKVSKHYYISKFLNYSSSHSEYKFIYDFNTKVFIDKINFIKKLIKLKENFNDNKEEQLIKSILWAKEFDLDTWIPDNKKTKEDFYKIILSDMFSDTKLIIEKMYYNNKDISTIEIPNIFEEIKRRIYIASYHIDTRNIEKWNRIKKEVRFYKPLFKNNIELSKKYSLTNIVSKITGIKTISQAWLKMYEILTIFDIINTKKDVFRTYNICEAPGNFISAIDYYIKTKTSIKKYDWNAQSLNFKNSNIKDTYGFIKNNPNKWDLGIDKTGDITNLLNIKYYGDKYCKNVDLITSDCGILFTFEDNTDKFLKLYYSQSIFMLLNLPENGNFVAKYFIPINTNIEISIIYLFYEHFKEVIFYKPLQNFYSREIYIICKGYKPITKEMKEKLIDFHNNFNSKSKLILDFPIQFISQLSSIIENLSNNWIYNIDKQLYYSDNYDNLSDDNKKIIRDYIKNKNDEWVKKFKLL